MKLDEPANAIVDQSIFVDDVIAVPLIIFGKIKIVGRRLTGSFVAQDYPRIVWHSFDDTFEYAQAKRKNTRLENEVAGRAATR
ncbi:hypothetical protein NVSP9465_01323 [Novosphingobium sp. CECT 9465]|nr:hypothetical protein NVSP9465_01323 [Novosphingobium sp. CECT 9465]